LQEFGCDIRWISYQADLMPQVGIAEPRSIGCTWLNIRTLGGSLEVFADIGADALGI